MLEPFSFKKIDHTDKALMEESFRLRFQVYCKECGFIKEKDYPNGIETDEYDDQSVHFAALSADGDLTGTLRMILPGKLPLPIVKYYPDLFKNTDTSKNDFVEISRLVISKNVRRRKNDQLYYEPQIDDQVMGDGKEHFIRRAKPMAFGIYRELYRESKSLGINQWYTIMEKSLYLLLRIHGFKFECIGPEIDFFGPVNPYVGRIDAIEHEVKEKFEKFYQYFTEKYKAEQEESNQMPPQSTEQEKLGTKNPNSETHIKNQNKNDPSI